MYLSAPTVSSQQISRYLSPSLIVPEWIQPHSLTYAHGRTDPDRHVHAATTGALLSNFVSGRSCGACLHQKKMKRASSSSSLSNHTHCWTRRREGDYRPAFAREEEEDNDATLLRRTDRRGTLSRALDRSAPTFKCIRGLQDYMKSARNTYRLS